MLQKIVLLFLTGQSLALAESPHTQFSVSVNETPGAASLKVDLQFFPATQTRFKEVINAYSNMDLQNDLNSENRKSKAFPNNLISTHYSKTEEANNQVKYHAKIGVFLYHERTGLLCTDLVDSTRWTQHCDADFSYEETKKYSHQITQDNYCNLEAEKIVCHFESYGRAKRMELNRVGKFLGIKQYSATQMAMMGLESSLDSLFMTQTYLESSSRDPEKAVAQYLKSIRKHWVNDLMKSQPVSTDAEPPIKYSN